ncbi:hypothetical protein KSS87_007632 [Heliosperma pusillum]|nr:hypothetical protein KSS87_007632 [Heliosperma pusillum]
MVCKAMKEIKGFNERKTTVFKKAKQLSTLCDVELLLILYGSDQPNVPQIWCSKPEAVNDIISKYRSGKRVGNKVAGNSEKQELKDLGIEDLKKLAGDLECKIDSVNEKLNFMKRSVVGSDYYCFDGFDFGNNNNQMPGITGYEERVQETEIARLDSVRQADVGSDYYRHSNSRITNCFHDQMLFFGGSEGKESMNQTEGDVDLQDLLMQFEVDDF